MFYLSGRLKRTVQKDLLSKGIDSLKKNLNRGKQTFMWMVQQYIYSSFYNTGVAIPFCFWDIVNSSRIVTLHMYLMLNLAK